MNVLQFVHVTVRASQGRCTDMRSKSGPCRFINTGRVSPCDMVGCMLQALHHVYDPIELGLQNIS